MTRLVEPPSSVLLLVGREDFSPPTTFGGRTAVATHDCVAVTVQPVDDGPTSVTLSPEAAAPGLVRLGEFEVESEGLLSLRDVHSREYDAMGVDAGPCVVVVWGDDETEPGRVAFEVRADASAAR